MWWKLQEILCVFCFPRELSREGVQGRRGWRFGEKGEGIRQSFSIIGK